jgi:hypothetical protein
MRNDQHLAYKLRRQGKSYKQIKKELGIASSTLSNWFAQLEWSQAIKTDLTRRAAYIATKRLRKSIQERKVIWERNREEARQAARRAFATLIKNPLFIAGIMLYWGEGDNKIENGLVRLSNTNQHMIRVYTRFLLEICAVPPEKLRVGMILYPDLKEAACRNVWSEATGLPKEQFHKTQYIQGRHPSKRLSHGICMISTSNRLLKEKIVVWIDLLQKMYPSPAS